MIEKLKMCYFLKYVLNVESGEEDGLGGYTACVGGGISIVFPFGVCFENGTKHQRLHDSKCMYN